MTPIPCRESKGDLWTFIADDSLVGTYSLLLRKITGTILSFCEEHPSGYSLPLSDDDRARAAGLLAVLKKRIEGTDLTDGALPVETEELDAFHRFIKPFVYPFSGGSGSRWDDPMECFFALYALQEDGTFKSGDMSQVFAHLLYLIRSTILYEADLRVRKAQPGTLDLDT
jgi:hypothetical protein